MEYYNNAFNRDYDRAVVPRLLRALVGHLIPVIEDVWGDDWTFTVRVFFAHTDVIYATLSDAERAIRQRGEEVRQVSTRIEGGSAHGPSFLVNTFPSTSGAVFVVRAMDPLSGAGMTAKLTDFLNKNPIDVDDSTQTDYETYTEPKLVARWKADKRKEEAQQEEWNRQQAEQEASRRAVWEYLQNPPQPEPEPEPPLTRLQRLDRFLEHRWTKRVGAIVAVVATAGIIWWLGWN